MDIIREIFDEQGRLFAQKLASAGFSGEQIRVFFPLAEKSILSKVNDPGIALTIIGLMENPTRLLGSAKTDIDAQKLGMSPQQVKSGFDVIVPVLSLALWQKSRGLIGSIDGR